MLVKTVLVSALLSLALCIPATSIIGDGYQDPNLKSWEDMDNLLQEIVNELTAGKDACTLDYRFPKAVEVMYEVLRCAPPETGKFWGDLLAIARGEPTHKTKIHSSGSILTSTEAKELLIVDVKNYYYIDGVSGTGLPNQKTINSENRYTGHFIACASRVNFVVDDQRNADDYFKAELDHCNVTPKASPKRKHEPSTQETNKKNSLSASDK